MHYMYTICMFHDITILFSSNILFFVFMKSSAHDLEDTPNLDPVQKTEEA